MNDLSFTVDAPVATEAASPDEGVVRRASRRAAVLSSGGVSGAVARFEGAPRWLVVFADLVALLLAFFVLILSMSSFEPDAVARLSGAPAGAAGALSQTSNTAGTGTALAAKTDREVGAGAQYLASVLMQQVDAASGTHDSRLYAQPGGALLIVPAALVANAAQGSDMFATLQRVGAAAPGRVTVFASSALGDAASLMASVSALNIDATGVETGFAGWLEPGDVAISIRNPRRGHVPGGGA